MVVYVATFDYAKVPTSGYAHDDDARNHHWGLDVIALGQRKFYAA